MAFPVLHPCIGNLAWSLVIRMYVHDGTSQFGGNRSRSSSAVSWLHTDQWASKYCHSCMEIAGSRHSSWSMDFVIVNTKFVPDDGSTARENSPALEDCPTCYQRCGRRRFHSWLTHKDGFYTGITPCDRELETMPSSRFISDPGGVCGGSVRSINKTTRNIWVR